MREPLLWPFLAIGTGIVLGQAFDFRTVEAGWPALSFALLAALPSRRLYRITCLSLCLLFSGAFLNAAHRPTRVPYLDAPSREMAVAEGCVVEPTVFSHDRAQFVLELEPGARARVQVPRYTETANPPRLSYGQRVEIEARFRTPRNFRNAGAFDYAAYLSRREIFWTALVPAKGAVRVIPGRCGSRWRGWIFALRTAALDRIEAFFAEDDYASAMLQAVLIGESAGLERIWTEDFRRSGTYHALVISGIHVSVLAGLLLALLRFAPVSKNTALALTAAVAWLYALVSGFTMPVARAAAGFTLYLVARVFFRRVRPLNFLAAIAIGLLAWDPGQLFEASFQLSFLSVAAIAAFAAPLLERHLQPYAQGMRDVGSTSIDPHLAPQVAQMRVELRLIGETVQLWTRVPLLRALALSARGVLFAIELAVLSLSVQVGLSLPMGLYFHRISFTGLSANLVIVPLMNAVVPLGFAAVLSGWGWVAQFAGTMLRWAAEVAKWHAVREPAWRVPDPPLWMDVSLVAAIVVAAVLLRRRWMQIPALLGAAGLVALLIASPWQPTRVAGELELTAIDVGQGDSLLLVFPQGKTMLIDGGGRLEYGAVKRRSQLDIGEDVVSSYLWSRGFRHIDVIAATHAHQDHVGGLRSLIENFHPDEVWTGANPPAWLHSMGVAVRERQAPASLEFSGATIDVLAPAVGYVPSKAGNNDSLVLKVRYGARSFLLMGDLESAEEQRLLGSGALLRSDVLKVGHHGSRTSTGQEFLDAVSPSIAMISAGYENSFGHPHADVVGRLEARHTTILRTDQAGLSTVRTDGKRLNYQVQAWASPRKLLAFPARLLD